MRKLTQEELNEIAKKHKNWLNDPDRRAVDKPAVFNGVELNGLRLNDMDLDYCEFINSVIDGCEITGTTLIRSEFRNCEILTSNLTDVSLFRVYFKRSHMDDCRIANSSMSASTSAHSSFSSVIFHDANMTDSVWKKCELEDVTFECTNCTCTKFKKSDLLSVEFKNCDKANVLSFDNTYLNIVRFNNMKMNYAYFTLCELRDVSIETSDLTGSEFRLSSILSGSYKDSDFAGAIFHNCDIDTVNIEKCQNFVLPGICPETGSFIGYKKANVFDYSTDYIECIIELEIPDTSRRVSTTSRLCRTDVAMVRHIWPVISNQGHKEIDFTRELPKARSKFEYDFEYVNGEPVKSKGFCDEPLVYGPGIHFFLTKYEALRYTD